MDRKTLKILLVHSEFKDIVQLYVDQSENFDGEVVDVFYGEEYQATVRKVTSLSLKNSTKFGGSAELKLDEENTLVIDAINLWVETSGLPFVVNGFERVSVKERGDNSPFNVFWLVEVRTK